MAVDKELVAKMRKAASKTMHCVFFVKGVDGKLLISPSKISAKEIAETKKEFGGVPIIGKIKGTLKDLIFHVAKDPPPTAYAAFKKVCKRDMGLSVEVSFRKVGEKDLEADEGKEDAGAAAAPEQAAPAAANQARPDHISPADQSVAPGRPAAPAAPGQAVLGIQKALRKLGFDPGAPDGVMGPPTQDAIKAFQKTQGLPADGKLGPPTQTAIARALQGTMVGRVA
jgi:hypothetical protein